MTSPGMANVGGDRSRNGTGRTPEYITILSEAVGFASGVFSRIDDGNKVRTAYGQSGFFGTGGAQFDLSRVVPTGATEMPRSWASLATCYLGQKAT